MKKFAHGSQGMGIVCENKKKFLTLQFLCEPNGDIKYIIRHLRASRNSRGNIFCSFK